MAKNTHKPNQWYESLITALAVGGFLIILGAVFGLTPGMPQKIVNFFADITLVTFPVINGSFALPAPAHPTQHLDLYNAIFNFFLGIGILQVAILTMRLWAHSTIGRIAETVGNIVFWIGGAIIANVYLLAGTLHGWFTFWPSLIILAGVSLIAQFIIRIAKRRS